MKIIGICAGSYSPGWKAMFDALGEALGVSFERRTFGDDRRIDGWVMLAADRKLASEIGRAAQPCYVVLDETELLSCGTSSTIAFSSCAALVSVLRGRNITSDDAAGAKALPHWLADIEPLAFKDGLPVWGTQTRAGCRHHYVTLTPPELNDGEALFDHFSGQRIASLLPLILFVRSVAEEQCWEPPPLQAAFMFDDPNLHWPSYGFIDYREMVRHAVEGNYHVSVATIPLDGWFVHPRAGAIFNENKGRLSLLYHGNDHISNELARYQSADDMHSILHQAVGRIARMEARTDLDVARVMAPPHGACSQTALSEMARLGFEAVCVSRGSLRHHNRRADWTQTIGMKPCDVVAGLPVIPRFGLTRNCCNDILVAALLHQPIVPMTHHQALADGYGLLDEIASFVNSLGKVSWRDMKMISRSLYSQRNDGDTLLVKLSSKRVTVAVPPETTRVRIDRPWLEAAADETLFWRTRTSEDRRWSVAEPSEGIAVRTGMTIEIASVSAAAMRYAPPVSGPRRWTPVARRVLTEVRDRALPSLRRLARKR